MESKKIVAHRKMRNLKSGSVGIYKYIYEIKEILFFFFLLNEYFAHDKY